MQLPDFAGKNPYDTNKLHSVLNIFPCVCSKKISEILVQLVYNCYTKGKIVYGGY